MKKTAINTFLVCSFAFAAAGVLGYSKMDTSWVLFCGGSCVLLDNDYFMKNAVLEKYSTPLATMWHICGRTVLVLVQDRSRRVDAVVSSSNIWFAGVCVHFAGSDLHRVYLPDFSVGLVSIAAGLTWTCTLFCTRCCGVTNECWVSGGLDVSWICAG
jgi:hypothetical protein